MGKLVEKLAIALVLIFVTMLLIPNKGAFGYVGVGHDGYITCPGQTKPINIDALVFQIYDVKPQVGELLGVFSVLVPPFGGSPYGLHGSITKGIIQGPREGPHNFSLAGILQTERLCHPEGETRSTAPFIIQGACDGSRVTLRVSDGERGEFTNVQLSTSDPGSFPDNPERGKVLEPLCRPSLAFVPSP